MSNDFRGANIVAPKYAANVMKMWSNAKFITP